MGKYTDIEILSPTSAAEGEVVPFTARITNGADYAITVRPKASYDGATLGLRDNMGRTEGKVNPGWTKEFSRAFTMPPYTVWVVVESQYRLPNGSWQTDDSIRRTVALKAGEPVAPVPLHPGYLIGTQPDLPPSDIDEERAEVPAPIVDLLTTVPGMPPAEGVSVLDFEVAVEPVDSAGVGEGSTQDFFIPVAGAEDTTVVDGGDGQEEMKLELSWPWILMGAAALILLWPKGKQE